MIIEGYWAGDNVAKFLRHLSGVTTKLERTWIGCKKMPVKELGPDNSRDGKQGGKIKWGKGQGQGQGNESKRHLWNICKSRIRSE